MHQTILNVCVKFQKDRPENVGVALQGTYSLYISVVLGLKKSLS